MPRTQANQASKATKSSRFSNRLKELLPTTPKTVPVNLWRTLLSKLSFQTSDLTSLGLTSQKTSKILNLFKNLIWPTKAMSKEKLTSLATNSKNPKVLSFLLKALEVTPNKRAKGQFSPMSAPLNNRSIKATTMHRNTRMYLISIPDRKKCNWRHKTKFLAPTPPNVQKKTPRNKRTPELVGSPI